MGLALLLTLPAAAEEPAAWEFEVSGAVYVLPHEEDFVQPTLRADRDWLHLESRYSYEDRHSLSAFAGASFPFGKKIEVTLTPMLGGVVGDTDGIVPGLEADLGAGMFEAYGEAEVVFDLADSSESFFYLWSELSLRPRDWIRAGVVAQRTRVLDTDRDVQRGLLVGFTYRRLEGTVYAFNPGGDDHFTVVSLGLAF